MAQQTTDHPQASGFAPLHEQAPKPKEFTARALLTGLFLGALLTPCNIYSGLKIGWSFNMSITALLLAYAFWRPVSKWLGLSEWTLLQSNINQTAASSAASIISGGLVAPIPAFALLSGANLALWPMVGWVFSVSFLGIWLAWYLRDALIRRSALPFPAGVATAETLRDIFSQGQEATRRVVALLSSLVLAVAVKWLDLLWTIPRWAPNAQLKQLTFHFDPSLLLVGFGAIVGLRAGLSLLLGAAIAWGWLGPHLLETQLLAVPAGSENLFALLIEWLLWPGVALMLTASVSGFALGLWRAHRLPGAGGTAQVSSAPQDDATAAGDARLRLAGLIGAGALVVLLQMLLFGIAFWLALLAIPVALLLATVAARVVGETGIPPIGAIGKVSQLSFGLAAPGQTVTNLMTANVAGGAAGQCADLLNDFKAGYLVGATPRLQIYAQCGGILVGSLVGSWVYLLLIPDPQSQLITAEWPAPAVATWKAVAETLSQGLGAVPLAARWLMLWGALAGLLLGLLEALLPPHSARWLPSGVAMGLAFVIPASTSLMICSGALLAFALYRTAPAWARKYSLALAAGLVAGESLFGVASSLLSLAA